MQGRTLPDARRSVEVPVPLRDERQRYARRFAVGVDAHLARTFQPKRLVIRSASKSCQRRPDADSSEVRSDSTSSCTRWLRMGPSRESPEASVLGPPSPRRRRPSRRRAVRNAVHDIVDLTGLVEQVADSLGAFVHARNLSRARDERQSARATAHPRMRRVRSPTLRCARRAEGAYADGPAESAFRACGRSALTLGAWKRGRRPSGRSSRRGNERRRSRPTRCGGRGCPWRSPSIR
jgi:hypothetical protein